MNRQRFIIFVLLFSLTITSGLSTARTSAAPPLGPALSQVEGPALSQVEGPGQALPAGTSADWRAAVQQNIRQSEYHVTWQEQTYLPDLPAAYQAPNRAHNLRTYFTPTGICVIPRTPTQPSPWQGEGEGGGWEWGLALTGYGYAEDVRPAAAAELVASANRIEYRRPSTSSEQGLTEWYVNDERGLEQGFALAAPPQSATRNPKSEIVLELALTGDLTPHLTDDGAAVELTTPGGERILRYGDLHATDATGRELPAQFAIRHASRIAHHASRNAQYILPITLDSTAAVYPITIAPTLTALATPPSWTGEGNQAGALFGTSVGMAGDVNGDGYDDIIVGAYLFDAGQTDEGAAAVYHGSATGLTSAIPNWIAQSDQDGARLGFSVGTAGDVNGDGYDDVVVGAYYYDVEAKNEGRAYVYHGSATGLTIGPADWTADGERDSDQFGVSVGTAGDVNGDGYDDVIVGAWFYDDVEGLLVNQGRAYVYYGSTMGLSTSADWTAESNQDNAQFGVSVGTAGDVNGDGYDDVIVGAWLYDNDQTNEGRAYVYHGSDKGPSTTAHWMGEGNQEGAQFGVSVGTAGDVNGDGYDDVIIGIHLYDYGQPNEGAAIVHHGSATGLSSFPNWAAESNQAGAGFGISVGTAGDLDSDGYDDVVVGAWLYDNGETNEGAAAVYHGSATGLGWFPYWMGESDQAEAGYGFSVGTAGDVNNDGYDDLIVGAPGYDNGQTNEGRAYVYYSKPDLVITSVWAGKSSDICYQVRNIGEVVAPLGHSTRLSIDGAPVDTDLVAVNLGRGERWTACFSYTWSCTSPQDIVSVCADYLGSVSESDETNNCTEKTWSCDTTPPTITYGPTVSETTTVSATVFWTTDEDSDSLVRFGRKGWVYEARAEDATLTQNHVVTLTGLEPSTTYHYVVESTDASSNTVTSGGITSSRYNFFETAPLADSEPPLISSLTMSRAETDPEIYDITAYVSDNIGVEKVEFYLDDTLIGIAYSPAPSDLFTYEFLLYPDAMGMIPAEFHSYDDLIGVASDWSGLFAHIYETHDPSMECEDITMHFEYPYSHSKLYIEDSVLPAGTIVPIEVYAAERHQTPRRLPGGGPPGALPFRWVDEYRPVSSVDFYVNTVPQCTLYPPDPLPDDFDHTYTCDWDASGLGTGDFAIRVDATVSEDCQQTIIRDIPVEIGVPLLSGARDVSRIDNYFRVELTVANLGTASTYVDSIEDNVDGFQPIGKRDDVENYEVIPQCMSSGGRCTIEIDLFTDTADYITLDPLESRIIEYLAVPVLHPDSAAVEHVIGADPVRVVSPWGWTADESFTLDYRPTSEIDDAKAASDYLIVTDAGRLFGHYAAPAVNDLLSALAELATLRAGILGYVSGSASSNSSSIDGLIGQWGRGMRGSDGVADNYFANGYLLIVGETEIIPTFTADWDLVWNPDRGEVDYTDRNYAITDSDNYPDLIDGRIIGDDAARLQEPIQSSIGIVRGDYNFDNSHAFAVSGSELGRANLLPFADNRSTVAGSLRGAGYSVTEDDHPSETEFFAGATDQDVIFLTGHGNWNVWDEIDEGEVTSDFSPGSARPLIYAQACRTGRYPEGRSLPEAFLDEDASAYIGATENAIGPWSERLAESFFRRLDPSRTVGEALKHAKHARLGANTWGWDPNYNKYNVAIFHLYGDPKLEPTWLSALAASQSSSEATLSATSPITSIDITIPDYQVTVEGGNDHIEIPGGRTVLVPGQPAVPSFSVLVDYPRGYRVQDVTLITRGGLVTDTGLNIPNVIPTIPGTVSGIQQTEGSERRPDRDFDWARPRGEMATTLSGDSEWWPDRDFDWTIQESPGSTTTLVIEVFPFYYNPLTTDARFYKDYSFDIAYISSTVEIALLATDKDAYPQGDDVLIDLWVNNAGDAQDVIVDAVVRAESSGEVADGLPLRTLSDLSGLASFFPQWDSSGFEPGNYTLEVEVRDSAGNVLDREMKGFRLGVCSGEITTFTATPASFDIGDTVDVSLVFNNTGTVPITGTAVIKIRDEAGEVAQEFSHDIANLATANSISFDDAWDTSGADEGTYNVVGYVMYDAKATEPSVAVVNTMRRVYLPLVLRSYP